MLVCSECWFARGWCSVWSRPTNQFGNNTCTPYFMQMAVRPKRSPTVAIVSQLETGCPSKDWDDNLVAFAHLYFSSPWIPEQNPANTGCLMQILHRTDRRRREEEMDESFNMRVILAASSHDFWSCAGTCERNIELLCHLPASWLALIVQGLLKIWKWNAWKRSNPTRHPPSW